MQSKYKYLYMLENVDKILVNFSKCLISHVLASLGAYSLILYIHVTIHVVIS